jgi:hypothetical protein
VLSAVTTFSACFASFMWYVAVMLSVCVRACCTCLWDRQVHQTRTHTDNITATYQINEAKQAEKVVTALSTKDDPLRMVKQL